jgi:1,4-alpha-glucan branching enzyme
MEFSLFAPHTGMVELIGSWDDGATAVMDRGDDGFWRTTVDLADGRYTYTFRLVSRSSFMRGRTVDVADPRARLVDDWQGDASVIVIGDGQDVTTDPSYGWQHDDEPLPSNDQLVIYELHIGEFGANDDGQGTFVSVIDRLDYVRDLGVNAVELMPVMAFPGSTSWGYNVRYPFSLESAYGTPTDFKRLVDECHARGIRVILDVVLNHSESEAPLTRIDFEYWYRPDRKGVPSFGPPFDYERYDESVDVMPAVAFALETVEFWVREYHIDGYRLDATAPIDNFDIVRKVRERARAVAGGKPMYVVAEELPEKPSITGPDGPADGAWHQRFQRAVLGWMTGGAGVTVGEVATVLQPANSGYSAPELVVNYVESHDEQPLLRQLQWRAITGDAAFRRHKLASTLLFTAVGIPMLYQGQEFGGFRERDMEIRPLQWELLGEDYGLYLKEHVRFLAGLRRGSAALTSRDFELLHRDDAGAVIVYRRGTGDDEILVAVNLSDQSRTLTIPFPDGAWRKLHWGKDWDTSGGQLVDRFAGSEAKLFAHR